jgi:hypothetical protein
MNNARAVPRGRRAPDDAALRGTAEVDATGSRVRLAMLAAVRRFRRP